MKIVALGPGDADEVLAAGFLFDQPPRAEPTRRFLAEHGHHILIAYDGEGAVGYVTGVETTHPDKGTEMFLYELAVAQSHRRRGIGSALVRQLAEVARHCHCYGMWVATEIANRAARATYECTGAVVDVSPSVVFSWRFDEVGDLLS
ncbi:MAG: GNAT family N-acetyltransferase [Candidatus Dormiibacterota bacterium]